MTFVLGIDIEHRYVVDLDQCTGLVEDRDGALCAKDGRPAGRRAVPEIGGVQ